MRAALESGRLQEIYDRAAAYYDVWHGLATARSDQRGRRMLVDRCVAPGDRVLDAGGGTGRTTALAARAVGAQGAVVLVDFSPGMVRGAVTRLADPALRRRVSVEIGDILHLPFDDGAFDVVLSTYSLCPLADPVAGATEMYRVLKPGGLLGVAHSSEPRNAFVRWMADGVERVIWRLPQFSLGCRSVSVLPDLVRAGAETVFDRRIGVPLWPFHVFAVRKPAAAGRA